MVLGSIFMGVPSVVAAEGQRFVETFDNSNNTGTGYITSNFVGVNGITWSYVGGRGDLDIYGIEGKGLMFRRQGDGAKISATIDGGIKDFSIDLKRAFTNTTTPRTLELLINNISMGTYTLDNNNTGVQKFQVNNINAKGTFTMEIRHISGGTSGSAQVTLDNITWTSYDGGGQDTQPPTITHTPVMKGHISSDLEIKAIVTDNIKVENVKLFYRTTGETQYKSKDMILSNGEYTAIIPKAELNIVGLQYYIEASDGTNSTTSPLDTSQPYSINIVDNDILPPAITSLQPADGEVLEDTNRRPVIKAEYTDSSGIDINSVKVFVDNVDVTLDSTVEETIVTYTPNVDMELGKHTVTVKVKDTAGNEATKSWFFTIGEAEYNFYFGQLHSHTNLSDGTGTPDDAYTWARDRGKADFFAVTDHSNSFDNDKDNENITDVSQSTSTKWKTLNTKANQYNKDGEYVAIAGYEMTWSGSTGGWGHMNTFNTPWFVSRSNSKMNLQAYYDKIAQWPESINQLNHPGKTFGDFADFGFYTEAADRVVQLIEVGNGEGPIRGSGYFPSYEYYTRALDKGWHLAPSNNQDNHKGNWITSNEARTVVLSENRTRDSIYDGIRNMRVYSTENKNLEIMYKINDEIMGSQLDSPEKLNFSINVNEPDKDKVNEKISRIDIISNGGVVAATKNFDSHNVDWKFELTPKYDYYYVKVTQANKDISVTAPIWTKEVHAVTLDLDVSADYIELGSSTNLTATLSNNDKNIITSGKLEFYVGSISPENKIGEETVTNITQGSNAKATLNWTPQRVGEFNIYLVATIEGMDKQLTVSRKVEVVPAGSAIRVMVDFAHKNHYVSGGDYADKIEGLKEIIKNKNMIMIENHNEITDEVLEGIDILIITSPQPIDRGTVPKSKLSDSEIQAVKRFTDRGGSLILTSRANYSDGTGEYQNSVKENKILNAIGSNIIFNSDQVIDNIKNGGQPYRLYFDTYTSTKYNLTSEFSTIDEYSFYSGCSVLLKDGGNSDNVDFLVKGHTSTKNDNAGKVTTGYIPLAEGNVYVLAAEILPSGGKVVASGNTFFSDFEISGDNRYSNGKVASKILDWLRPEDRVEVKTIREVRNGMPENFGEKFTIEGRITSQSVASGAENAFFDCIYVQDETAGINIFGISQMKLPLGTKVRITGTASQYEGDYQLQIKNELVDLIVLDDPVVVVEPREMTTGDSMKKENEGWLVKIKGIVTGMNDKGSLFIDDGSGEARIYVNGYIGDGSGDRDKLGKWDPNIKVGDTVSAIGLASTDSEGPRLRVRNTAEIIKVVPSVESKYPLLIGNIERVEEGESLKIRVNVENLLEENMDGVVIVKLTNNNDRPYRVRYSNESLIKGQNVVEFNINLQNYSGGIKEIKVYIWDNLDSMKPLAEAR